MTGPVLHVNTADTRGGAEQAARALHLGLVARGIESALAVGFVRGETPAVHELGPPRGARWWLHRHLRAAGRPRAARLARAIAEPGVVADLVRGREDFRFPGSRAVLDLARSAAVVHLHNLHGGYFDLELVPELSRSVPTVLTLHDEWTFTGHCAYTLGCERWQNACGKCPHLDVYPRLRRDGTVGNLERKRRIYERSRLLLVAPSRWLLDRAASSVLGNAATDACVIPNGVDLDCFAPGSRVETKHVLGVPAGSSVLVFTGLGGRQNPFKDVMTLERALERLGDRTGQPIIAFALGEPGPAKRLGRVELRRTALLGATGVAQHLRAADVYVHAARAENHALSVLEALATGVPVVASRVGGVPEQVHDLGEDATGILVASGDDEAMADAVDALLVDAPRRERMGLAARVDAEARFGVDRFVAEYIARYESL